MPNLHRLIIATLVSFSIVLFAAAGAPIPTRVYFLDGVDRKDGMSAAIDFKSRTIGVAGDMVVMKRCIESDPDYCFASDYMSFSEPAGNGKSWTGAGSHFVLKGKKNLRVGRTTVCVDIISSRQKWGSFLFYFNRGVGLVGWKLRYMEKDGKEAAEEYLVGKIIGVPAECMR